jgi:hypothetical protein
MHAEGGEGAVGVDDIKSHASLLGGWVGSTAQERGFQWREAVETPGGVGDFLGELGFGGGSGLVFVEELAAVALVFSWVFGGERRIRPARANATLWGWGLGAGGWRFGIGI